MKIPIKNLYLILTVFLLFIFSYFWENKVFSNHFVDEEENFAAGMYILRGEKLYGNFLVQHQPLTYIFSAGIQKATNPNSVYLLIKRHREFVISWSIFWTLFLIWRFGLQILLGLSVFELVKINHFGNLFLPETLIVYPLLYLSCLALMRLLNLTKKINTYEILFVGLTAGLSLFLVVTMWPLTFLLTVLIVRSKVRDLIKLLPGILIVVLAIVPFISINDYFKDVFYINYKWYIPQINTEPALITWGKALVTPIWAFLPKAENTESLSLIRATALLFLLTLGILIKRKKYLPAVVIIIFILGLSNIRFTDPGRQFYQGFHIQVWLSQFIMITFILSFYLAKQAQKYLKLIILASMVMIFIMVISNAKNGIFRKVDREREFYVNYSRQIDIGQAIKIMKGPNDSLFVVPDEFIVYLQSDINHFSNYIYYYAWMNNVPFIREFTEKSLQNSPPTFLYLSKPGTGFEKYLSDYEPLKKNGDVRLYIVKNKVGQLSEDQINKLRYLMFEFN